MRAKSANRFEAAGVHGRDSRQARSEPLGSPNRLALWLLASLLLTGCSLLVPQPDDYTYGGSDAGTDDADVPTDGGGDDAGADAGEDCGALMQCGGDCVDTMSDVMHCGGCDDACADGEVCRSGSCFDPVVEVSAGPTHNCARRGSGSVICWGYNEQGQIGDGSVITRTSPVPVTLAGPVEQVVAGGFAFSSGNGFTCARFASGALSCWGEQAGDTPLIDSLEPTGFTAGPAAIDVSLGDGLGCAITPANRLSCWGTLAFDSIVVAPMEVGPPGAWATDVDAGLNHVCAVHTDGRVFCMGSNGVGQLGLDPMVVTESATFREVPGLNDVAEVSVGASSTCARRSGGQVVCWGLESVLGIGSKSMAAQPSPQAVNGVSSATSLEGGGLSGTCAILSDASVTCWGFDYRVALGGDQSAALPYQLPGASDVSDLAVGYSHLCVTTTAGTVRCIGRNFWGTLGDGTTDDSTVLVDALLP